MAVKTERQKMTLKLDYVAGLDEAGKKKIRSKNFSNVNVDATDEALLSAGNLLGSLLSKEFSGVRKVEEHILTQGE